MNFINKYLNGDKPSAYQYAEEFMEKTDGKDNPVIYSVGDLSGLPLITKTTNNGTLIWERTFQFGKVSPPHSFYKIIKLSPAGIPTKEKGSVEGPAPYSLDAAVAEPAIDKAAADITNAEYVLHAAGASGHFLMGITRDGVTAWCNQLAWPATDINVFIEPSWSDDGFYLVISGKYEQETGSNHPFIAKMQADGSFLFGYTLQQDPGFIVNAVRSHATGVSLAGLFTQGNVFGIVMYLNFNLNITSSNYIKSPFVNIHDILIINPDFFLISGYLPEKESLFVTGYYNQELSFYLVPDTAGLRSRLCYGSEWFYLLQYDEKNGVNSQVHKVNYDFTLQWTKTLVTAAGNNGIRFLNYQLYTNDLTFTAAEETIPSLLVHTDADLTSCQTKVLDMPDLQRSDYSLRPRDTYIKETILSFKRVTAKTTINEPATKDCCAEEGGGGVVIDENTKLQSPNFYLQSAGSTGADGSARGIHLRWIFAGALGQKHLPKGDYAATSYNFNKPADYVTLYRAAYIKSPVVLELGAIPYLADDGNKVWLYRVGNKVFYVYFRNPAKYTQVRNLFNPLQNPIGFINAYGGDLIEIENKKELFFAVEPALNITGINASIKTETLSVAENALAVSRTLSSRKKYSGAELNAVRLVCENGRSIRIACNGCSLVRISFEFYSDFILSTNSRRGWQMIDRYALTLDDATAFTRLEPTPGLVDGKWQRYNNNAFVNISNYQNKWNGPRESWDRNIKNVVQKYIDLSNVQNNPRALEQVPLQSGAPAADDLLELSNLDLLNMAGYDFHIARMLGLGTLDVASTVQEGQFIYIAQYTTTGNLEDGGGARTVHHLAMGIPVSAADHRLPVPISLKEIKPGAFWGSESPEPVNLTDANGYTQDGRARYVTLYSEQLPEDELNKPFYFTSREFNAAAITYPVYAGLEYKKNTETDWVKPELPNDPKYLNKVATGFLPHNETIPLVLPEPQKPLFVHRQRVSGTHYYGSYGINWFSRAASSSTILSVLTNIQPTNPLKPPININALLVRQESPLLLTSQQEQNRYSAIGTGQDHTLIRLSFDYHTYQELIDYKIPIGANINDPNIIPADNTEIFADEVELFFRNQVPNNVSGRAISVTDHPTNSILSIIQTGNYIQTSTGDILQPIIPASAAANFIGGVFIMGNQQYIIHQVVLPTGSMQGPEFTVFKKEISNGIVTNEVPAPGTQNLESPEVNTDGLFMAVENMQNPGSWGTPNPLPLKVYIGANWAVNREVITIVNDDGSTEQHLEKARGFWDNADILPVNEPVEGGSPAHKGLYKITFQNLALAQHGQYSANNVSVEWYQGIIRVHTVLNPNAQRKTIKVLRAENIGTTGTLVLYAYDPSFVNDTAYDKIKTGIVSVNYYPGYKVYLYADAASGLTQTALLPGVNEDVRYSIFGLRSHDIPGAFYSRISVPQLMFAQQQVEPAEPELPRGALYSTRPDFFGRATYSFTTKYQHRPHGVLTCRADDESLLNALYKRETINTIREHLKTAGGNDDPFFANRWQNFIDFTALWQNGDYLAYPPNDPQNGYKFPNPDKQEFFDWANSILTSLGQPLITEAPGVLAAGHIKIREFVKGAIFNAFVPLTEVPVIYQYIKNSTYNPLPKKQVIRDRNGNVLKPSDPGFDMAPMMKITGGPGDETMFTDFTLDGTSNNIYFYGVRELNTQMKMSGFSPFLGPVKLVNTRAPEAPEIKRIMPVLENPVMGIPPAIQFEVNAYPEVQHVKKLTVYRALSQLDAQSVRTMKKVKIVDLDAAGILGDAVWTVVDGFEDLTEIPYNDGLYYKITASREIEYADIDGNIITEYAPSQPSKLTATLITEAYNPPAPVLSFTSDPITPQGTLNNVVLKWNKTAYKAKYHLYKMNNSGNWAKIHEITTNDAQVVLPLAVTDLQSGTLQTKDANGNTIYSHFKAVAENTSGMLSMEENILTIP